MLTFIGRGGLAGACAGLLSGVVSLILAEPVIDRAIALEHERAAAAGEEHVAELFSRDVQHVGLLVAAVLTGVAFGILFGALYAWLYRRDPLSRPWERSIRLAAAAFLAVGLIPFLRFPANPPGVGDPATINARTVAWLSVVAIGITTVVAAWLVVDRLAVVAPLRHLAAAGVVIAGLVLTFAVPGSSDTSNVPPDLLWTFRLFSLMTISLVWAGLGVGFGLAGVRSQQMTRVSATV